MVAYSRKSITVKGLACFVELELVMPILAAEPNIFPSDLLVGPRLPLVPN